MTEEWSNDSALIRLDTPQSDALTRMEGMTHQYYDPADPSPLPEQIIKRTVALTHHEEGVELRAREKAQTSNRLSANSRTRLMLTTMDTVVPQEQKTRYGQVDMYMGEGDISSCLEGLINASAVESVYCTHPDKKIAEDVNDTFEITDMSTTMKEIATSFEFYGNAFPSQVWKNGKDYVGTMVLNPKNIAVSRNSGMSVSNLAYRPPQSFVDVMKQVQRDDMWYWMREEGWEEFMESGYDAIPLNKDTTCHISNQYLSFLRYGVPRISKAARAISTRHIMEEMRRSTIEGVKNQLIALTLENPSPAEVKNLNALVKANRSERITYFVWRDNLKVQHVVPGAIDQLLAPRTWEQINVSVFRNLNVPIYVTGDTNGEDVHPDIVKQSLMMLLMQASNIQQRIKRRFLAQWTNMYNGSRRISKKNALRPGHFMFVPTSIDAAYRIEKVIQPLATFGLISRETAAVWAGLRWDRELQKIIQEDQDGVPDLTRPFTSFSQEARDSDGNKSKTESISKPGRTPDAVNPNKAGQPDGE